MYFQKQNDYQQEKYHEIDQLGRIKNAGAKKNYQTGIHGIPDQAIGTGVY